MPQSKWFSLPYNKSASVKAVEDIYFVFLVWHQPVINPVNSQFHLQLEGPAHFKHYSFEESLEIRGLILCYANIFKHNIMWFALKRGLVTDLYLLNDIRHCFVFSYFLLFIINPYLQRILLFVGLFDKLIQTHRLFKNYS